MTAIVLNLTPDSTVEPIIKLTAQIIKDAIKLKADAILLELDDDLHLKAREQRAALEQLKEKKSITNDRFFFELGKLPLALKTSYVIAGHQNSMAPAYGELFEDIVRIILLSTDTPYWKKGDILTSFETIKPTSKWTFESKDLSQWIELKRIRHHEAYAP